MTTLQEWDAHWQAAYDSEVEAGATPNDAVFTALQRTNSKLGPRPEQPLSAADLIMPPEEWS